MSNQPMERQYFYTRFERFWHWFQGILIVFLLLTGLEVHGLFTLFGFQNAVEFHDIASFTWLVLYVFIIFWMLTTGDWKNYIPTTKKLMVVARYYMIGIFKGEEHPVPKSQEIKHNPLQRMTYLGITIVIIPFQMITGFLYYTYNSWAAWGLTLDLGTIAWLHTLGAYLFLAFLIVHIYMVTTGHGLLAHMKGMITGYEDVAKTDP